MISLRQNENLIKTVRRHWSFLLPAFLLWMLLPLGLLVVRYLTDFNFFDYWSWVITFASLVVFVILLYKFFLWRNNALIITDQRIIENEQYGFFSKTVTELLYRDIQEISYDKHGLNASLYNYGDVRIRTASENEILVDGIPDPAAVVETINRIRQHV